MKIPGSVRWAGLAVLLVLTGCGKSSTSVPEQADYTSARDQVVQKVKTGQLKPGDGGLAALPPELQSASISGQIIANQDPTAGWVVVFPLQQGRTAVPCFLYIEKTAPPTGQALQVGSVSVIVGNKSEENHWYQAMLNVR